MTDLLFAYGTLRQGLRDDLLRAAGTRFVGGGTIQARLYDLGPYPGIKRSADPDDRVCGEVHRLLDPEKALAILDEYEGFIPAAPAASEFVRERVRVTLDDGGSPEAWAYFCNRPVDERRRLPRGDYRYVVANTPRAPGKMSTRGGTRNDT